MPRIMGIVNTTPDSFSDGGRCILPGDALDHALRLEDAGADILDIGGESTRPYSEPVPGDEELRRVIPVLEKLRTKTRLPISIDTSKARVAKAAIEAGAEIINDVTGLTGDSQMLEVAVNSRAGVCAMHMQGTPQTMQDAPTYQDVVDDILQYLAERSSVMIDAGIAHASIVLDPGIGFGKTHEHNLRLLREVRRFHALGFALLVGHSRKGFIGDSSGASPSGCHPSPSVSTVRGEWWA
jgi:dihydropteroate synthase